MRSPHRALGVLGFALLAACFGEAPQADETADGGSSEGTGSCAPVEQPMPQVDCPAMCNGGCAENECQILCRPDQSCADATLVCPEAFACDVDCEGEGVCSGLTLTCGSDFACSLSCSGADACANAEQRCGFSECSIECGPDPSSCAGTSVRCSEGACLAECAGTSVPYLDRCEQACECGAC